jgi:hypothetical protein
MVEIMRTDGEKVKIGYNPTLFLPRYFGEPLDALQMGGLTRRQLKARYARSYNHWLNAS